MCNSIWQLEQTSFSFPLPKTINLFPGEEEIYLQSLGSGVVPFELWKVLEQLIFLDLFLQSSCYKKYKHLKKMKEKKLQNALTSHYANGHGDPCDKWVKKSIICFHRPPGALFEGFRTPWCPTIFFFRKNPPV